MGLFSGRRRLSAPTEFRSPIRLHSEQTLASIGSRLSAQGRKFRSGVKAATNDARVVGGLLVLAAAALAYEMARSFGI